MVIQQGKLLRKAEALLIVEQTTKAAEREAKLKENCPPLKLSGTIFSLAILFVTDTDLETTPVGASL